MLFRALLQVLHQQFRPGPVHRLLCHISRLFLFLLPPIYLKPHQLCPHTMVPTSKPSESPTKSVAPSRKPSSLVPSVTRISHPSALPTAMPSMSSAPSRQASHLAYLHLRQIQVPNPHRSRVLRTNFKSVIRSIYESTIFSPTNSTTQR